METSCRSDTNQIGISSSRSLEVLGQGVFTLGPRGDTVSTAVAIVNVSNGTERSPS